MRSTHCRTANTALEKVVDLGTTGDFTTLSPLSPFSLLSLLSLLSTEGRVPPLRRRPIGGRHHGLRGNEVGRSVWLPTGYALVPSGVPGNDSAEVRAMEAAREAVGKASSIVALTGAGISTDSGIPDFRGPQGVWTKNPEAERTATLQHYLADPDIRKRVWQTRLHSPAWTAQPNRGHLALVDLESRGRLTAIVTQNIDGMHQKAGSDPHSVIEVHGTMRDVTCWSCGLRTPMPPVLERVQAGEDDPPCLAMIDGHACGGILKSATISFGQALDPTVLDRAVNAVQASDLLLAIGSTLAVHPAAGLVPRAARSGIPVVIVNADPTPYDGMAVAVVRTPISAALTLILDS